MYHFHKFGNSQGSINNNYNIRYTNTRQNVNKQSLILDSMPISQSINLNQKEFDSSYPADYNYSTYLNKQDAKISQDVNLEEILSFDLITELNNGNNQAIDEYITKILNQNLGNSDNYDFSQLIYSFQLLLNYIFNIRSSIIDSNNAIESNLDRLHQQNTDHKLDRVNQVMQNQQKLITKLKQRQSKLKTIIVANGHENRLIPNSDLLYKKKCIYVCDVCEDTKIYRDYEKFHSHYVRRHIKRDQEPIILPQEQAFDMKYFDKKIRNMTNEMINALKPKEHKEEEEKDDIEIIDNYNDVIKRNEAELNEVNRNINKNPLINLNTSIKMNVYSKQKNNQDKESNQSEESLQIKRGSTLSERSSEINAQSCELEQVMKRHEKDYLLIIKDFMDFKQDVMTLLSNKIDE